MKELFEIEDSPSPRLKWIKKHNIGTLRRNGEEYPWEAWIGDMEEAFEKMNDGMNDPCLSAAYVYGFKAEEDAIVELAIRNNIKLWFEQSDFYKDLCGHNC